MKTRLIGIAGPSGVGKTTVANKIQNHLSEDCVIIHVDDYFKDLSTLTKEELENQNFDEPNSIDFALLVKHLKALLQGQEVLVPQFDFVKNARHDAARKVSPKPYIIVEGFLALHPDELTDLFEIKIFIKADPGYSLRRRLERDVLERGANFASALKRYKNTVGPMCALYVEPSKKKADLVVTNNWGIDFDITPVVDYIKNFKPPTSITESTLFHHAKIKLDARSKEEPIKELSIQATHHSQPFHPISG